MNLQDILRIETIVLSDGTVLAIHEVGSVRALAHAGLTYVRGGDASSSQLQEKLADYEAEISELHHLLAKHERNARLGAGVRARLEDAASDDGTSVLETTQRLRDAFDETYDLGHLENLVVDGDVWAVFDAIVSALCAETPT